MKCCIKYSNLLRFREDFLGDLYAQVLEDPRPLAPAAKKLERLGSDS
jgi:hypothetical protein